MCGIAGFSLTDEDQHVNSRKLARTMLLGIEHRGRDASGAAWFDRNGRLTIQKTDKSASEYVGQLSMYRKAPTAILHTRAWTSGHPSNNENNHPIVAGHVVGVHNGFLEDENDQWRLLGVTNRRRALVDSEALFATLAWGLEVTESGKPRIPGATKVGDLLEEVPGKVACAWFDETDPRGHDVLHLAKGSGSPVELAVTRHGSILFASTRDTIDRACEQARLEVVGQYTFKEGEYQAYHAGQVIDVQEFKAPDFFYSSRYISLNARSEGLTSKQTVKKTPAVELKMFEGIHADGSPYVAAKNGYDSRVKELPTPKDDRTPDLVEWLEDLLDPTNGVSDTPWFSEKNRDREVDEFLAYRAMEGDTDADALDTVIDRGGAWRVGDWVVTDLGLDRCFGQIAAVPDQFPGGTFIVRLLVPTRNTRPGDPRTTSDAVLVARTASALDSPAGPSEDRLRALYDSVYEEDF